MKTFENKTIWVIGASSGLGEALSYAFNKEGANIILSARQEDLLNDIKNNLSSSVVLPIDLEQSNTFEAKTEQAINAFGTIDYVILNAGVAQRSFALETQEEVERKIMQIDYFSYTQITKYLLPHFTQKNKGHIVVISGLLAHLYLPGRTSYAAAKSALLGYFGCLRAEVSKNKIEITVLIPGSIKTELANKALNKEGVQIKEPTPSIGIEPNVAAIQILEVIKKKKHQAYIGNKDKVFLLWKLSRIFPNFIIKLMLKQNL